MPSRSDVWSVGRALVLVFYTCVLGLSCIAKFYKA